MQHEDNGLPLYGIDDMATLLNTVVAGIRTGDNGDDRVYSLPEVAERTGFSLKQLMTDCQRGLVEHTHRGRFRGMTSRQIALLVSRHRRGGDLREKVTAVDAREAARQATLATSRGRTRRAAA